MKFPCTYMIQSARDKVKTNNQHHKVVGAPTHLWTHSQSHTLPHTIECQACRHDHRHSCIHLIHTHIWISLILTHLHYTFVHLQRHLQFCTPTHTNSQTLLTLICDLLIFMTHSCLHLLHELFNCLLQWKSWNLEKARWIK